MSNIFQKIQKAFKHPKTALLVILYSPITRVLSDEIHIKLIYRLCMGKSCDLDNPQTFNEKLQWLKLHDRNPLYTKLVDKYEVKKYVANIIGEEYIIPTYGVWNHFEDVDFKNLPDQFVIKCTHDSGSVIVCRDKKTFDYDNARIKINKCLKNNLYWEGREWPYKDVKPRIIAEKYMEDEMDCEDNKKNDLKDYKFFCFDGVAKALFIASDRQIDGEEVKFDFFDADFKHLPFTNGHPNAEVIPAKPETFEKMKRLAEKLSKGIPHVRVDFYEVNGKAYFGELTFSHWSGFVPFKPEEWDKTFGDWIDLPGQYGGAN